MGYTATMVQTSNTRSPQNARSNGSRGRDPMSPNIGSRIGPTSKGAHVKLISPLTQRRSQQRRVANTKLADSSESFKSRHAEAISSPYGDAGSPIQTSTAGVESLMMASTTPSSGSISSTGLKALLDQLEKDSEASSAGAASSAVTPRPSQIDFEQEDEWFTAKPNMTPATHRSGMRHCNLPGSLPDL